MILWQELVRASLLERTWVIRMSFKTKSVSQSVSQSVREIGIFAENSRWTSRERWIYYLATSYLAPTKTALSTYESDNVPQ